MDIINIGNDIKVVFKFQNVSHARQSDIKYLNCYFVKYEHLYGSDHCFTHIKGELFPQYYNPTEYTIHSCGFPMYNVMNNDECNNRRFCGFGVNSRRFYYDNIFRHSKSYGCNIPNGWTTDNPLTVYFPGHDQTELGKYKLMIHLVLNDENWGINNVHEYLFNYDDIFELVTDKGMDGNIIIDLVNKDSDNSSNTPMWYVGQISATKSQFAALSDLELINNAIRVPYNVKEKELVVNRSCWYVMIPGDIMIKGAKYVAEQLTTTFSAYDIIDKTDWDGVHENITINGKVYKVYMYRNYAFMDTPAVATFYIE